ncbi:MAG: DNA-binding response regulator [Halomonadaceae bacterium]|nr:MAG: DNA-binding response regulator [Halomonadaceae bacterium]
MKASLRRGEPQPRVLVVEDQIDLADNLLEFLGEDRYCLDFAPDGLTALHLLACNEYDVIVLDIMLPGVSGLALCQRIRQDLQRSTPIILTTARGTLEDKEAGFAQGADDYLVKPFALRELQLRIDALYRRGGSQSPRLEAGPVRFEPGTLKVWLDPQRATELKGLSAHLFEQLMRAYPRFCSYEDLARQVWGAEDVDSHTVRTQIYSLRKHLQATLGSPLIRTVHGRGYCIEPPQDTPGE